MCVGKAGIVVGKAEGGGNWQEFSGCGYPLALGQARRKLRKSIITWLTKTTPLGTLFSVNQWQNQVCIKDIIPISSALPTNFKFTYYSFERSDMISARAILNLL